MGKKKEFLVVNEVKNEKEKKDEVKMVRKKRRRKKRFDLKEEKKKIQLASRVMIEKIMKEEREKVLLRLMGRFRRLSYCDLEEVYNDACLVLWNKMMSGEFELREECLDSYLMKVCWNIGMHYLRKVRDEVMSLDEMEEWRGEKLCMNDADLGEMYDVLERKYEEERCYELMEGVWERLSEVDRMILECYYLEGCKMEDIAHRIGYKNGNSVKNRKRMVLKRMIKMVNERMMAA